MSTSQIEKKQAQSQIPYETAKAIRRLLDEARKSYGASEWDADGIEETVLELVTSEE